MTEYPALVTMARKGLGRTTYHGVVIRLDRPKRADESWPRPIAYCDHEHRYARRAVECAERLARHDR